MGTSGFLVAAIAVAGMTAAGSSALIHAPHDGEKEPKKNFEEYQQN